MLRRLITPELATAFHHCERKAFLLLRPKHGVKASSHAAMMEEARTRCVAKLRSHLLQSHPDALPFSSSGIEAIL